LKTFADLEFGPHMIQRAGATQARMSFPNGYGVSVIAGPDFYTRADAPYELAVMKNDEGVCYDSGITTDVLGYLTADMVTEIMAKVQALPPR
jgi:hypothetical protein